jgi:hypothetical protein
MVKKRREKGPRQGSDSLEQEHFLFQKDFFSHWLVEAGALGDED